MLTTAEFEELIPSSCAFSISSASPLAPFHWETALTGYVTWTASTHPIGAQPREEESDGRHASVDGIDDDDDGETVQKAEEGILSEVSAESVEKDERVSERRRRTPKRGEDMRRGNGRVHWEREAGET